MATTYWRVKMLQQYFELTVGATNPPPRDPDPLFQITWALCRSGRFSILLSVFFITVEPCTEEKNWTVEKLGKVVRSIPCTFSTPVSCPYWVPVTKLNKMYMDKKVHINVLWELFLMCCQETKKRHSSVRVRRNLVSVRRSSVRVRRSSVRVRRR